MQANASLVGLAVRFAPCRPEFEHPRGRICWPEEAQFICVLKKNPLICPTPKHRSKARPVSRELRCRYVRVGQRFGGFLDLCEKIFFLSTVPGGCLNPRGSSFFYCSENGNKQTLLFPFCHQTTQGRCTCT
jgi:hypothetical protein